MSHKRELDLNESIDLLRNHEGNSNIQEILTSFEKEDYDTVVKLIAEVKGTLLDDSEVIRVLLLLELTSYLQLGRISAAKETLRALHSIIQKDDYDKQFILGEMAYQFDLKLARKIMSELTNSLEASTDPSYALLGEAYLLLAEIEETMDKLPRALTYYRKGMEFLKKETPNQNLFSIVLYKMGMLNSALRKDDEAIKAFEEGLALTEQDAENKIHILVSLGKIYSSKNEGETAFPYFSEALFLIGKTDLRNKVIHAETLTEVGFYYFKNGQVDDAWPFYKQALTIYQTESGISNQKLGMIYMQYAYCLHNKQTPNMNQAELQYEAGLKYLEDAETRELYENAVIDVISFFTMTKNKKKKRYYENKLLEIRRTANR